MLINEQFTILSSRHSRPLLADLKFDTKYKSTPLIIFCHGFKGFKDWGHFNLIAMKFASRGYAFLKFNFSHNGTTIDHPTEFSDLEAFANNNISKELDDLQDVINAVRNKNPSIPASPIDRKKICLIGHSRGGGIAILKAGEDPDIAGVSAWAPVDDFKKRYSDETVRKWKKEGVYVVHNSRTGQDMPLYYQMVEDMYDNPDRIDIARALRTTNIPLLAIHGTNDETLNHENTIALKKINTRIETLLIEGANHTFGGSHPWTENFLPADTLKALNATDKFFKEYI